MNCGHLGLGWAFCEHIVLTTLNMGRALTHAGSDFQPHLG